MPGQDRRAGLGFGLGPRDLRHVQEVHVGGARHSGSLSLVMCSEKALVQIVH